MAIFNFSMYMTVEQCQYYYQGKITAVVVTGDDGKTIQLPINRLRPFITSNGIRGRFRLTLGDHNQFVSLEKIY